MSSKERMEFRGCNKLGPDGMWNPLRKYPPNKGCFCGSGNKAKKCCLPRVAPACGVFDGNRVKQNWNKILRGEILIKG